MKAFLFSLLPRFLRYHLIRRKFKIDERLCRELTWKVADTEDEFEGAFRLLYEAYGERGLTETHSGELHASIYQALPSTHILIAKSRDKVVATASLVVDTEAGLPSDAVFSSQNQWLRSQGVRLCEVSGLAIARSWRRTHGLSVLPIMIAYILNYFEIRLQNPWMVFTCHPRAQDFYQALFAMKRLGSIQNYSFVQGALAVYLYVNLDDVKIFMQSFAPETEVKLFHGFCWGRSHPYFELPLGSENRLTQFRLTPELLQKFFEKRSLAFQNAKTVIRKAVKRAYANAQFEGLSRIQAFRDLTMSRPFRYPLLLNARVKSSQAEYDGRILDLSWKGALVEWGGRMSNEKKEEQIQIVFEIHGQIFELSASIRRIQELMPDRRRCGLEFQTESSELKRALEVFTRESRR